MKKTMLVTLLGLGGAVLAGSAMAHQAGDVIIRAGGVFVDANSSSKTQSNRNLNLDVDLKVKNDGQLGLTATYLFTDNIGVELLGATPFSHNINAKVPALGAGENLGRVANVKQLPPSLYAQYYFFEPSAAVKPYVGAGLNYTRFYHAESRHALVTNLKVKKHSFGPVINAGVDLKINDNLYFNAAAWYTRIKTTATFDTPALGLSHEVKIKLDPVVYFAGLAYRF